MSDGRVLRVTITDQHTLRREYYLFNIDNISRIELVSSKTPLSGNTPPKCAWTLYIHSTDKECRIFTIIYKNATDFDSNDMQVVHSLQEFCYDILRGNVIAPKISIDQPSKIISLQYKDRIISIGDSELVTYNLK